MKIPMIPGQAREKSLRSQGLVIVVIQERSQEECHGRKNLDLRRLSSNMAKNLNIQTFIIS
jgi:hypothetical protein